MRKKGFTLIELIVVMAIISILVLLGVPKYKSYVQEANLTKIKVNVKAIESASMQYYMKNNDWPRLKDEPYTAEQIEDFGKKILDKTGEVVILESEGKYYDIDFAKIDNYVKLPDDNVNYILQNPVGKVFFIEGITDEAKVRISDDNDESEIPEEPEIPVESIKFQGLSSAAFDKDNTTASGLGTVTWEGNLENKKVTIDMAGGNYSTGESKFTIYDINGNQLNFINLTTNTEVNVVSTAGWYARLKTEILVPEGAVKFIISNISGDGSVYDIYVNEILESPKPVYDITSTSADSNITLNWKQDDVNYEKTAVYRNGKLVGITSEKSYIDKPLNANTTYTYNLKAINSYGNASNKVSYIASTTIPEVIFSGLSASAFDKDNTTSSILAVVSSGSATVTWEGDLSNKKVTIDMAGGNYSTGKNNLKIYDINNTQLTFMDITTNTEVNVVTANGWYARKVTEIIVPESAVKFVFSGYGSIYDIYVTE